MGTEAKSLATLADFRSSLIHFAYIGVASSQLVTPQAKEILPLVSGMTSKGGATPMQAKCVKY